MNGINTGIVRTSTPKKIVQMPILNLVNPDEGGRDRLYELIFANLTDPEMKQTYQENKAQGTMPIQLGLEIKYFGMGGICGISAYDARTIDPEFARIFLSEGSRILNFDDLEIIELSMRTPRAHSFVLPTQRGEGYKLYLIGETLDFGLPSNH